MVWFKPWCWQEGDGSGERFGALLGPRSKAAPGDCPARGELGSGKPRIEAKASSQQAVLGFPSLAFAFPIFLPLPPSPEARRREAVCPSRQPLSLFPLPPVALPAAGREPAEDLVGSTGSCLFSRSVVPDPPSLR